MSKAGLPPKTRSHGARQSRDARRGPKGSGRAADAGQSLHDEVVGRLRDMIVEGDLVAGARVPERTLCERLGISRTPLREAFKVLASEGLLTIVPNRGALVARMTLGHVDDVMQLLGDLEARAAELACAQITDAEIDRIACLHERMVAHHRRGELMEYFKTNQAIHEAIVDASGNRVLAQVYRGLGARIRRFRFVGNRESERWERAVREHEHILMALRDRDAPLLREAMRAHVRNGWLVVRELVRDEFTRDAAGVSGDRSTSDDRPSSDPPSDHPMPRTSQAEQREQSDPK